MPERHPLSNLTMTEPGSPIVRVGLVACSAGKSPEAAAARNLYTSPLFRKASTYAEATCDRWYVLSALHGLVHPDQILSPYDHTLRIRDYAWADRVVGQLEAALADVERPQLVILAGARYRAILDRSAWPYKVPMLGLSIGQQFAWLTDRIAA